MFIEEYVLAILVYYTRAILEMTCLQPPFLAIQFLNDFSDVLSITFKTKIGGENMYIADTGYRRPHSFHLHIYIADLGHPVTCKLISQSANTPPWCSICCGSALLVNSN
jgi:hypothetical protein